MAGVRVAEWGGFSPHPAPLPLRSSAALLARRVYSRPVVRAPPSPGAAVRAKHVVPSPSQPAGPAGPSTGLRPGVVLAVGAVACIAVASVLIGWAAPIPSTEIAFWRLLIASAAVLGVAAARRRWPRYRRGALPVLAGVGLVTAVHFL